jgi:hypothetical protein
VLAIQTLGEDPGRRRLTHSAGTRKEVGVADPVHLDRVLKRLDNGFLADNVLKNLRPELAGDDLILHSNNK